MGGELFIIIFLLCCIVVGILFLLDHMDDAPVRPIKNTLTNLFFILIGGSLLMVAIATIADILIN